MKAAFCERCGAMDLVEKKGVLICMRCGGRFVYSHGRLLALEPIKVKPAKQPEPPAAPKKKPDQKKPEQKKPDSKKKDQPKRKKSLWLLFALLALVVILVGAVLLPGMLKQSPAPEAATAAPTATERTTATPTATPSPTPTAVPTATPSPTPTATPTATPSPTPTPTATPTPTPLPRAKITMVPHKPETSLEVYMHNGEQLALWGSAFTIANKSDVPFTVEGARAVFYAGEEEDMVSTFKAEEIENAEKLRSPNGSFVFAIASNHLQNTHVIVTIFGTDAHGHAIEVNARVDFKRDETYDQYMNPAPTPTPTPAPCAEIVIEAQQKEISLIFVEENGQEKAIWRAVFRVTNKSNVPFTVEGMRMTYYMGEVEHVSTFSPEESGNIDALRRRDDILEITCDTDIMEFTHMILAYFGTDANGHAIEVSDRVDFLRDEIYDQYMNPVPTPTPTPVPEPTQSAITITAINDMARVVYEPDGTSYYDVQFSYANGGEVPITPEYIVTTWYENDSVLAVAELTQKDLHQYLHLYKMNGHDQPARWSFGIYEMCCTHVETVMRGVDDNGRVHETVLRVPCEKPVPEPTPTPTPAPKAVMAVIPDRWERTLNFFYDENGQRKADWHTDVTIINESSIPIELEVLECVFYVDDVEDIRWDMDLEYFDDAALQKRNGSVEIGFPTTNLDATHAIITVCARDANGHLIEESIQVEFVRDKTYYDFLGIPMPSKATATPAPAAEVLPAAKISVTANKDVAYVENRGNKGLGYDVTFIYTNESDVPFNLEYIYGFWCMGDKVEAEAEIPVRITLKKGETYEYPFGTDQLNLTSIKSTMKGTDANGNYMEAECTVQYVKTFADGSAPY